MEKELRDVNTKHKNILLLSIMSCPVNVPQPAKQCPAAGKPVNPILGCKILTEEVDHGLEGFRLKEYVLDPKNSKNGVTIASGFDLGARNSTYLKGLGLNEELISKLDHYLKKEGTNALKYFKNSTIQRLTRIYNKKSKINFNCLTKKQQTVVSSVFFQYGTKTPNFLKYATSQQWNKVSNDLRNFGDIYPTRRNKEADYLKGKK